MKHLLPVYMFLGVNLFACNSCGHHPLCSPPSFSIARFLTHTHSHSHSLCAGLFGLDNASFGKVDEEIVKTWWEAFVNNDPVRLKQDYPWELAWARYVTFVVWYMWVVITCVTSSTDPNIGNINMHSQITFSVVVISTFF